MPEYVDGPTDSSPPLLPPVTIRDGCCPYGNHSLASTRLRTVSETRLWGFLGYMLWGSLSTGVPDKALQWHF